MELIWLWGKLIFFWRICFLYMHSCLAFLSWPNAVQGRGSPCCAGGIAAIAEQDRALWWQRYVGRDRAQCWCAPLLGLGSYSRFGCSALKNRQWAEGVRPLSFHHETVAVNFHLWASVSHLSATHTVSVLSLKCSERSSVDGIRARQQ